MSPGIRALVGRGQETLVLNKKCRESNSLAYVA